MIRNAVDVAAAPRSRHDRPTPRLIAVGRLKAPKDFLTLIRACALLAPGSFEALIVGDGPDRAAIEAEIGRLGLEGSVRLAGERADVPELLADSDVFVLSSRSEGLPVSVLEAMAAGLPVVASRVGGLEELVVGGRPGSSFRAVTMRRSRRRSPRWSTTAGADAGSGTPAARALRRCSISLRSGRLMLISTTSSSR